MHTPKQPPSLTKGVATWCMHGTLDEIVANTTSGLGTIPEHVEAVQKLFRSPTFLNWNLFSYQTLLRRVPNWRVPSHIAALANAPVPPPVKLLSKGKGAVDLLNVPLAMETSCLQGNAKFLCGTRCRGAKSSLSYMHVLRHIMILYIYIYIYDIMSIYTTVWH